MHGTEAHKVNGGLEHRHPIQGRVTGQRECHAFVAAGDISLETGAVEVVGTPLAGKSGLATDLSANEHAVVVQGVLVQQPGLDKVPNHLGGDASLLQIGEHPPLILIGDGQDEGVLFLFRRFRPGRKMLGRVPRPVAVELQQVVHCLREALATELLEEGDGVPTLAGGVAPPASAILDADAVHLLGGVVAAQPPHLVAQVGQQVRQVRLLGDGHLLWGKAAGCILI